MTATLVEFGNVGLARPFDFCVSVLARIRRRAAAGRNNFHVTVIVVKILVANHHAADGLFAEVFAQERIDLAGAFAGVRRDRACADFEFRIGVALDGNVVHAKSATVTYSDGIFACTHFGRSGNHKCGIAGDRFGKQRPGLCAVYDNLGIKPSVLFDEYLGGNIVDGGFFDLDGECHPCGRVIGFDIFCAVATNRNVGSTNARQIFGFVHGGGCKSRHHRECGQRRE